MLDHEPDLRESIDNLYTVFSRYELRDKVEGCPHCVGESDNKCIHAAPLRQLTSDNLARYAFKAMSTWGTVDDFKHFLPRVFELLSFDGGGAWIDPEVAFGKLPYGNFHTWSGDEQQAVCDYTHALWGAVIRTPHHRFDVDRCLCRIAILSNDVSPYLAAWQPARSAEEAMQFAALIEALWYPGHRWPTSSGWWKDRPVQARQVLDWVTLPERLVEIETAYFSFADDQSLAAVLLDTINKIHNLRQASTAHSS